MIAVPNDRPPVLIEAVVVRPPVYGGRWSHSARRERCARIMYRYWMREDAQGKHLEADVRVAVRLGFAWGITERLA